MLLGVVQIHNADALESRFGTWPSFHDAEILAVRLDSGQGSDGRVRLELDIHLFTADGQLANRRFNVVLHTIATLGFVGVDDVELTEFGPQNVLSDLVLRDRDVAGAPGGRVQVELPSSNGLSGAFSCEDVAVLAVQPYTPGPHSVYE